VLSVITHHAGRHAAPRRAGRPWLVVLTVVLVVVALGTALLLGMVTGSPPPPAPARATLAASTETLGERILDKAETRTGDWYVYGGAGPSVFDCSGLVYWAATQLGLRNFPRDTYEMEHSSRLEYIPLSQARRGDLMFYGSGHVEMDTIWYHQTFGAQTWGTRVGWHRWGSYWQPTFAMRVRW